MLLQVYYKKNELNDSVYFGNDIVIETVTITINSKGSALVKNQDGKDREPTGTSCIFNKDWV